MNYEKYIATKNTVGCSETINLFTAKDKSLIAEQSGVTGYLNSINGFKVSVSCKY